MSNKLLREDFFRFLGKKNQIHYLFFKFLYSMLLDESNIDRKLYHKKDLKTLKNLYTIEISKEFFKYYKKYLACSPNKEDIKK